MISELAWLRLDWISELSLLELSRLVFILTRVLLDEDSSFFMSSFDDLAFFVTFSRFTSCLSRFLRLVFIVSSLGLMSPIMDEVPPIAASEDLLIVPIRISLILA